MNIHEYQSKQILKEFGVKVPAGHPAFSPEEAARFAKDLSTDVVVVKAQIHAGGRGKAGGVKLAPGRLTPQNSASRIAAIFFRQTEISCIA